MGKKLVHIITSKKNGAKLTKTLLEKGFHITVIDGLGGFTKEKFLVIMLGMEKDKIENLLETVKSCCPSREQRTVNNVPIPTLSPEDLVQAQPTKSVKIRISGATVLVSPLEEIYKL
jgi:uncharacterized protein YaaQ